MNIRDSHQNHRAIRRLTVGVAALGLVALGTACSGEDLAESMIERQVESETGENFNIDLNGGECFSIQTEEGSMTCDEDGNMVIETPDGSAVVNIDDAGNVQMDGVGADGEQINMSADADGNMVVTGPDGSTVMNASEDGSMEITSDDGGTFSATTGTDLPEEFPSDIAIPSGFTVVSSSVMGDATMQLVAVTMETASSFDEATTALIASIESGGYEQQSKTETADTVFASYGKGEAVLGLTISDDGSGKTIVNITVQGS